MSIRTALSIAQDFRYGINEPAPSALFNSTDPDELQQLEHLNQVLEYLRKRGPFRGQVRTYDFTTVASTATYSLPGDYWEPLPLTHYNEDTDRRLVGPVSDGDFMEFKEGFGGQPYEYIWRIAGYDSTVSGVEGRLFEVYPTPGAAEDLTFEYISANLFLPAAWFASQDTTIHERLAADTDYCAFDADLVKLGLLWKYRNHTSKDRAAIAAAKADFDREITASRMRMHGITRVSGRRRRLSSDRHRPYVSPQSWSLP